MNVSKNLLPTTILATWKYFRERKIQGASGRTANRLSRIKDHFHPRVDFSFSPSPTAFPFHAFPHFFIRTELSGIDGCSLSVVYQMGRTSHPAAQPC